MHGHNSKFPEVNRFRWLPSILTAHKLRSPPALEAKTTVRPSGDTAGVLFTDPLAVKARGFDPSRAITQSSPADLHRDVVYTTSWLGVHVKPANPSWCPLPNEI